MDFQPGEAKSRRAGLADAEHLALAAQSQILLGDAEAVLGLAQDLEPRPRRFAERALVEQQAGRAAGAAPDPAAQLVQLRQAEALGVLDHHDRRLGTSTPTSTTVVATSALVSPRWKRSIAASFSGPFIRPWTRPTASPNTCRRSS